MKVRLLLCKHGASDITEALLDLGCYQVSLGDTIGKGSPESARQILLDVFSRKLSPADKLARAFP